MIIVVTQAEVADRLGGRNRVSADRVTQVRTAEEALKLVAQTSEDAAPMVTFVPDLEQLGDLLTRLESWPEINVIILFGAIGSNLKTFADYFRNEWIKSSSFDFF